MKIEKQYKKGTKEKEYWRIKDCAIFDVLSEPELI